MQLGVSNAAERNDLDVDLNTLTRIIYGLKRFKNIFLAFLPTIIFDTLLLQKLRIV